MFSYGKQKGNTIYVEAPAVSIDPDPSVIKRLDKVLSKARPDRPGIIADYKRLAASPQNVRVIGIPDCHASFVAVDCDYYLKNMANGTVPLPVSGWESLFDLRAGRLASTFR